MLFCLLSNVSRHFTVAYVVTRIPTKSNVAFISVRGIEVGELLSGLMKSREVAEAWSCLASFMNARMLFNLCSVR